MVGSMISWTTLGEKILFDIDTRRCSMTAMVSGPNSGATYARLPSIPNNRGGRDSADQNAACADSEKIESSQLFDSARRVMRQMWWRDGFTTGSLMTSASDDAERSDEVGVPPACGGERRPSLLQDS
jgi:hypothetical protein